MKISFDTPLTGTDATGASVQLTSSDTAALAYTVFVDTVNPPVKSYPVPAANIAAATQNANGSHRITLDAIKDLGVIMQNNVTYFVAIEDALGTAISPETAVLTYTEVVTPGAPQNPFVGP